MGASPALEDEEAREIASVNAWVEEQELPRGELAFELVEEGDGEIAAVLDLAWPEGIQVGLTAPVALLLNEDSSVEEAAGRAVREFGARFYRLATQTRPGPAPRLLGLIGWISLRRGRAEGSGAWRDAGRAVSRRARTGTERTSQALTINRMLEGRLCR